jgi:hypothetical protein
MLSLSHRTFWNGPSATLTCELTSALDSDCGHGLRGTPERVWPGWLCSFVGLAWAPHPKQEDNNYSVGDGMQQALAYAEILDVPLLTVPTGTPSSSTTGLPPEPSSREKSLDQFQCQSRPCRRQQQILMRITGDNDEGKAQLDNFIDPESIYPIVATTSRLRSTGVDAQTCHLIVLDRREKRRRSTVS